MATYKVIQDIEAEDKLIGPLTLRQSIYAGIAALFGYLSFVVLTHSLTLMLIIFLPPTLFAAFFAFPWGSDQTTEVWALAKIRFYLKSRRRLWDQTGAKELVTITAPKHETKHRTNGLTKHEVQNRLNALASTLDTRGWAVKNVYSVSPLTVQPDTDRLIGFGDLPQEVEPTGLSAEDDILDNNNTRAHQLQEMVTAASASHKQALLEHMQHGDMPSLPTPIGAPTAAPQWFTTSPVSMPTAPEVAPITTADEAALSAALHKRHTAIDSDSNLKTIQPLSAVSTVPEPQAAPLRPAEPSTPTIPPTAPAPVTATPDPATIQLSKRDDLNISTIARIAKGEDTNEVVISLH